MRHNQIIDDFGKTIWQIVYDQMNPQIDRKSVKDPIWSLLSEEVWRTICSDSLHPLMDELEDYET